MDKIKSQISIPLIADIHFNYKYALMCAERGIDAIRINPGNIGGEEKVKAGWRTSAAGSPSPSASASTAARWKRSSGPGTAAVTAEGPGGERHGPRAPFDKFDFDDICISVKCSDVPLTMAAYRLLSERTDYPLHLE